MTAQRAENTGWSEALRRRDQAMLQRLAAATACGLMFTPMLGIAITGPWLLGFLGLQGLERLLLGPIARGGRETLGPVRATLGLIVLGLSGLVFGGLSVALWLVGGVMGGVCAVAMISGGALYSTLNAPGSRRVLMVTAGPQFLYLIGSALFLDRFGAPAPYSTAALLSAVSFCLYCLWTWRLMNQARAAETAARLEAEARRAQAERRVRSQNAFLAAVGHDLRTPIGAILTGAAELEQDAVDAQARSHAALIGEAGLMMKAMLDDLLDQAKLDAGRMTVEAEPVNLRRLVARTARFWRGAASGKSVRVTLEAGRETPSWIRGDAMRLRQILNNLISNALKFTDRGHILIRVRSWDDEGGRTALLIDVEDTGPGMAEAQLARLFTPFDENNAAVVARHGGTGLGLAISKELATLMGGRLTARSAPGEGATFTLSLIVEECEAVERAADDGAEIDHRAAVIRAFQPAPALPTQAAAMATPAEDGAEVEAVAEDPAEERALRVLIVDDHEINRRAIQLILTPLGAETVQAADGLAALVEAEAQPFDVIFMDVRMPELDGRETTRRLRAGGGINASTPVIAVTADTAAEDIAACLEAGMDQFVSKPLTPQKLLGALTEALSVASDDARLEDAEAA